MTAVLFRTTASYLCRSHLTKPLNCLISSRAIVDQLQLPIQRTFTSSLSFATNKTLNKRISSKQPDLSIGEEWSIIAYNLSEELHIEDASKLFEIFDEYDSVDLPSDIRHEAAVLSLKNDSDKEVSQTSPKPRHDIFIFREGTVVFWGVPYEQQKRILDSMFSLNINPTSKVLMQDEREHLNYSSQYSDKSKLTRDVVQLSNRGKPDQIYLDQFAFSHAVALSVKLAIWETMLARYIESISWVSNNIKNGTKINLTRDEVFRKTGEIYEMRHRVNLTSDFLDLPDVYWDRHDQEIIFLSMISFLNVRKRTAVMNEKLNNCCELMNLLQGHMSDKHHVRLEWMIIVLIMVEVSFEIARFL